MDAIWKKRLIDFIVNVVTVIVVAYFIIHLARMGIETSKVIG